MGEVGLLNQHVGALPKRLRDGDSECLRGFEINPQLEFSWLLDRKIGGFCTAEDSVDKCGVALPGLRIAVSIED